MPNRRVVALLVLALAGGGSLLRWSPAPRGERADVRRRDDAAAVAPNVVSDARVVHFWSEPRVAVAPAQGVRPPAVADAAASALIAEQAALRAMAQTTDLELSPRQWAALAAATAHMQAVRQAYEASRAVVTATAPGRYRLDIPAYPEAGDALREMFHAELHAQLGAATAKDVLAALGAALEGYFGGFGVGVQTLEFAAGSAEADYQVTRTVRYWNSIEGQDRLTTRRETHFPGLEDPDGHTWGPFLAALAAGGRAPAGG